MPEMIVRRVAEGRRGFAPSAISRSAFTCAGVVPQHPPITLTHPAARNRESAAATRAGSSAYAPSASGSPAFGTQLVKHVASDARLRR